MIIQLNEAYCLYTQLTESHTSSVSQPPVLHISWVLMPWKYLLNIKFIHPESLSHQFEHLISVFLFLSHFAGEVTFDNKYN